MRSTTSEIYCKHRIRLIGILTCRLQDALLGNCGAVTDIPCIIFAYALVTAFPEAKVILTVRDSREEWKDSYDATIKPWFSRIFEQARPRGLKGRLVSWLRIKPPMEKMAELIHEHYLKPLEARGLDAYDDHHKLIKSLVPKDRLLVYNVKEGWDPLCSFLGQTPPELEFPHLNERETFPKMFVGAAEPQYVAGTLRTPR